MIRIAKITFFRDYPTIFPHYFTVTDAILAGIRTADGR